MAAVTPSPVVGSIKTDGIAIIDVGKQAMNKAIPALFAAGISVCALVDPRNDLELSAALQGIRRFAGIDEMLSQIVPEVAYVSVPHDMHFASVAALLKAGVHVIKEKPFALSVGEAQEMIRLAEQSGSRLMVATQRSHSLKYKAVRDLLPQVGTVRSVQVTESVAEPKLNNGWRANQHSAGGGVVIDLGYHMLHQLIELFGGDVSSVHATLVKTRTNEAYDVEDTAHILIGFKSGIEANVTLSRADSQRVESIKVIGDRGVITLEDNTVTLRGTGDNQSVEEVTIEALETSKDMLSKCFRHFLTFKDWRTVVDVHLKVVVLIEEVYRRFGRHSREQTLPSKWTWPRVTPDLVEDIVDQAHSTLSIYDNSGVIGEFETSFKNFHDVPDWHSLLHNSGTNALLSLYYSAGITRGDEVIVPVYTFHATVTPMMQLGAIPVFVDALPETGNIDPCLIEALISQKTKAVIVTHMWGVPCDMDTIVATCKRNNLLLLEDCSHAHGAIFNGKSVGTFGDGAAWSLQGEKVLTGGEGGITITPHQDMQIKMLLHGHFNKRCKVEIPQGHLLREFALTGVGMKNRSHPLAVAIAMNQLKKLPDFLQVKQDHAEYMSERLKGVPFLRTLSEVFPGYDDIQSSWYAFMIIFDATKAPFGWTRDRFVAELQARGLKDVDIPGSTKPLNKEALYRHPWKVLGHLYSQDYPIDRTQVSSSFPGAYEFFGSTFKLPVWAFVEDHAIVDQYINVIVEVAEMASK